jgi:hypothetical protein
MKINLQKTAAACGIFASGLIAGYTASRLALPLRKRIESLKGSSEKFTDIKIAPIIPDLDLDSGKSMDNLGLDLALE